MSSSPPLSCWSPLLQHYTLPQDNDHCSFPPWSSIATPHFFDDPPLSLGSENSCDETVNQNNSSLKTRSRDSSAANRIGSKACREKMRRDRLNDRFTELSAILAPSRIPKTDKASILQDATRTLIQLRAELQQLKDENCRLNQTIKELKTEKNDLRDEKMSLRLEKEKLEKHLKMTNVIPNNYVSHLPTHPSLVGLPHKSKMMVRDTSFSPSMTQWIPLDIMDISDDHILRPPVA